MKKFSCLLLFLSFFAVINAATGKCGANLSWSLDGNGVLVITLPAEILSH